MTTTNTLIVTPFLHYPKLKKSFFNTSKLNFDRRFSSLSGDKKYPFLVMADLDENRGATVEDLKIGVFEQEALIKLRSRIVSSGGVDATLNSLSKWLVAALFGFVILWRHDAEALWAASGSVLNAGLSTVLKRMLNQERPVFSKKSDPGMPSSHAQSIFFTVTFSIISMVEYFGLNATTAVISTLIFAIGSYFSWLRVSQQFHTTSQVAVGAALGFLFSVFWFWLWDAVVSEAFTSHLEVRIILVLGAVAMCVCFLLYVIRYWVLEEN